MEGLVFYAPLFESRDTILLENQEVHYGRRD